MAYVRLACCGSRGAGPWYPARLLPALSLPLSLSQAIEAALMSSLCRDNRAGQPSMGSIQMAPFSGGLKTNNLFRAEALAPWAPRWHCRKGALSGCQCQPPSPPSPPLPTSSAPACAQRLPRCSGYKSGESGIDGRVGLGEIGPRSPRTFAGRRNAAFLHLPPLSSASCLTSPLKHYTVYLGAGRGRLSMFQCQVPASPSHYITLH